MSRGSRRSLQDRRCSPSVENRSTDRLSLRGKVGDVIGIDPSVFELVDPDIDLDACIARSQEARKRLKAASLPGRFTTFLDAAYPHVWQSKQSQYATSALFEALRTYVVTQEALYEQMSEEEQHLFYPGSDNPWYAIRQTIQRLNVLLPLMHEPHGDDPD